MAESYENLVAWQKAMEMVTRIYEASQAFPRDEIYGLTSQLRRAAVSVAANIAEGKGRLSPRDFRNFLGHARGSLLEAETLIRIAANLHYLNSPSADELLAATHRVGRLLNGLIASLGMGPQSVDVRPIADSR